MNHFPVKIVFPQFILYIVLTEIVIINYVAKELQLLFLKQFLALNVDLTLNIFKNVYG
jgi:hypothetical protein